MTDDIKVTVNTVHEVTPGEFKPRGIHALQAEILQLKEELRPLRRECPDPKVITGRVTR